MAYLGNDLQVAFPSYRNIDDISGSFNGVTTSFPLTVDGVAPIPAPVNSQQCLISVNGVVQRPDDSGTEGFRLSGGNIIFASAPAGGVDFFGVILAGADYVNVGANFPSGSSVVPSITFDSDLDTGIYNPAGNQIGFTTGGTQQLVINSSGQISSNLGSAATPAFSFISDPNTGIYSPGADQLAISTSSTGRLFVDADGRILVNQSGVLSQATTQKLEAKGDIVINSATTGAGAEGALHFSQLVSDSSASQYGAKIASVNSGTYTAGDVYSYDSDLAFSTTLNGSLTEKFRIARDGKVGIGTTSVSGILDAQTTGNTYVNISSTDPGSAAAGVTLLAAPTGEEFIAYKNHLRFGTATGKNAASFSEAARIDGTGRLLVGTSNSAANTRLGSRLSIVNAGATTANQCGASLIGYQGGTNVGIAPFFELGRSRGTTDGTYTEVVSGDALGYLIFKGADGVGWSDAAWIKGEADGDWTTSGDTTDSPGRLVFSTTADGASSPTEVMRITSSGQVLYSKLGAVEDPSSGAFTGPMITAGSYAGAIYIGNGSSGNRTAMDFRRYGVQAGSIVITSAGATQFNTSSDYRLKENIVPIADAIDRAKQLKVVRFNYVSAPDTTVDGFLAHEVQTIVPEAISGEKDEVDENGTPVYQGIDQSKLVPLLTAALQEAIGRIETLESKVAALETP